METKVRYRTIASGYVIASFSKDIGTWTDPCTYISQPNDPSTWSDFSNAKIFTNEAVLAIALEKCILEQGGMNPQPMYWETTITTVDSDSLAVHIKQARRQKALAKLNDEDLVALDLMGVEE